MRRQSPQAPKVISRGSDSGSLGCAQARPGPTREGLARGCSRGEAVTRTREMVRTRPSTPSPNTRKAQIRIQLKSSGGKSYSQREKAMKADKKPSPAPNLVLDVFSPARS